MKDIKYAVDTKSIALLDWFDRHYYRAAVGIVKGKKIVSPEFRNFVSVTTHLGIINKPFFNRWRGDVGNRVADQRTKEAAESGSIVHHACTIYSMGGDVIFNPPFYEKQNFTDKEIQKKKRNKNGCCIIEKQSDMVKVWGYERVLSILKPQILMIEQPLISLIHNNGGTLDYLWKLQAGSYDVGVREPIVIPESGNWIVDIKTGEESIDHKRQLCEYKYMLHEMYGIDAKGVIILHLGVSETTGNIKIKAIVIHNKKEMQEHTDAYLHAKALWESNNENIQPVIFQFPKELSMKTAKLRKNLAIRPKRAIKSIVQKKQKRAKGKR